MIYCLSKDRRESQDSGEQLEKVKDLPCSLAYVGHQVTHPSPAIAASLSRVWFSITLPVCAVIWHELSLPLDTLPIVKQMSENS